MQWILSLCWNHWQWYGLHIPQRTILMRTLRRSITVNSWASADIARASAIKIDDRTESGRIPLYTHARRHTWHYVSVSEIFQLHGTSFIELTIDRSTNINRHVFIRLVNLHCDKNVIELNIYSSLRIIWRNLKVKEFFKCNLH